MHCWNFVWIFVLFLCIVSDGVLGVFEDVEIELGEFPDFGRLSYGQMIGVSIATIFFVVVWALGFIPLYVDLGQWINLRRKRQVSGPLAELSTYFLDCPLQFVCDVDAWASRDHEYFAERLIASWFRHPNHTWQHENAGIYAGRGTCREMYPCPFDVQEVVGIRIPGSQRIASGGNDLNVDDSYSFF
ncbi:uncharacterized protein [Macrobrachium rosenbergii]|uniref:uncharacterized protein isoform X2 n=1 Tax=Macrobrachium rosenbergii TaxID=79674 RepID=UPI0034D3BABF